MDYSSGVTRALQTRPEPPHTIPRRLQRLTEHRRTAGHLGSGAIGLAYLTYLPLCLCSSHCHPARQCLKKAHFFWRFCGVKNASERRTFLLRGAPKTRLQGAHPTASTALLVGSFQLAADSRLSTFDSQLFHSRPRLPLDSRNLRSPEGGCA